MSRTWSEKLQVLPDKIPYFISWSCLFLLGILSVLHSYMPLSPVFFLQEVVIALPLYVCFVIGIFLLEQRVTATTPRPDPRDPLNLYFLIYTVSSLFLVVIALPCLWRDLAISLMQGMSIDLMALYASNYLFMAVTACVLCYYTRKKSLEIKDFLRIARKELNQIPEASLPTMPPLSVIYTEFKKHSQVWARVPMSREDLVRSSREVSHIYQYKKQSLTEIDAEQQSASLTAYQSQCMFQEGHSEFLEPASYIDMLSSEMAATEFISMTEAIDAHQNLLISPKTIYPPMTHQSHVFSISTHSNDAASNFMTYYDIQRSHYMSQKSQGDSAANRSPSDDGLLPYWISNPPSQ